MSTEAATIAVHPSAQGATAAKREAASDLIERAKSDTRAFDLLMRAHEQQVLGVSWRLLGHLEDAQDAAQEVFLRLYRYLDRFDADRPLSPWLYRVTVNVCRDLGRRRSVRRAISLEDLEVSHPLATTDPAPDPGKVAALAEEQRIAAQAIASLAEKERAALVLRDLEGLSSAEVAKILGSSEATVRSQICRARLKIKRFRDRKLRRTS